MAQSAAIADRKSNPLTGQEPDRELPATSARANEAPGPEHRPTQPLRPRRPRGHRKRHGKAELPAQTRPTAMITRKTHALSPVSAQRLS